MWDIYYPFKRILQTLTIKELITFTIPHLLHFIFSIIISSLVIIWELFKVVFIILFYSLYFFFFFFILWSVYKLIALSLIEFLGVFPLVLFNTLIFLLIISNIRVGDALPTKEMWRYCHSKRPSKRWTYILVYPIESYPWHQIKFRGVSLADWVVVALVLYLILLLIILPLLVLGFTVFYFSLVTLAYIFTYFLGFIPATNFDLELLVFSVQFISATGPESQTKSKPKSEESVFVSNKFKIFNGLELPGILFHFRKFPTKLLNYYENSLSSTPEISSVNSFVDWIEWDIKAARSITKHGFIYNGDLTSPTAYPIISELIEDLLNEGWWETKVPELDSSSKYDEGEKITPLERLELGGIKLKSDVFKQAFHLLILNYWTVNRVLLNHLNDLEFSGDNIDAFIRVAHLNNTLTKLLPNSIKRHLHNKSICLTNNVYAGFDTEYKNIDKNLNKLLSVQVSVNGCYTLKVPTLDNKHVFGSFDVATNKFYKTIHESKLINYHLINSLIQDAIVFNFNLKTDYKDYILSIIEILKNKGVKYFIKDDFYHFKFPSSNILTKFIEIKNDFSMKNLFNVIMELEELDNIKSNSFDNISKILNAQTDGVLNTLLTDFEYKELQTNTVYDSVYDSASNSYTSKVEKGETTQKKRIRKGLKFNRFSIYTNNIIYLTAHYNAADLSMLSDFKNYKQFLNVVNKSFVVINKPLPFKQSVVTDEGVLVKNWNVKISDTMLLSPPGCNQLKEIGEIYNFNKLELTREEITNMDLLIIENRPKFKDYAVRDSIITLLHYNAMIDFNFTLESNTPPTTLSQISGKALDKYWRNINYEDYQVSPMYSLANVNKVYTFKGLLETKIGDKLPLFIQTFRGGRNESFSYGMDFSGKIWYDYDLTSAYTTIMYGLRNPIYNYGKFISREKFFEEYDKDNNWLLKSYFAIKCSFEFPKSVHYPCLPCNYDSENVIYPLKVEGVYTGSEIFAALNLNCNLKIKEVFSVPKGSTKIFGLIKDLHLERGKHKKGTFNNLMCKIIGNSAYGLTAQGINEIMRYDTVSNSTVRMKDSRFSNPIIAANISSFIRALLAEIMNNIHKVNGKIISVTTDGFITDTPNLENLLLDKINKGEWKGELLKQYREWRSDITNGVNPEALELKNSGPNMMSWTTRGQLSIESGIAALTGLQRNSFNRDLNNIAGAVINLFNSDDKTLEYISSRLRTASDIFKKGGHVTSVLADKAWSIIFDHKRKIVLGTEDKVTDYRTKLFFTDPHITVDDAWGYRTFVKTVKTGDYEVGETKLTLGRYKSELDLTVKSFIKALEFGLIFSQYYYRKVEVMIFEINKI
jgi:hypothetical protein